MTAAIPKSTWVKLYKELQREATKFPQYNYRVFAQRRIREHFEASRAITSPQALKELYEKGQSNLESLRRQVSVARLFPHKETIIEEKLTQLH